MKIRILHHPTITPGTIVNATEQETADWIRIGRGEVVIDELEAAIVAAPENAAARTTAPKPRGSHKSFSPKKG